MNRTARIKATSQWLLRKEAAQLDLSKVKEESFLELVTESQHKYLPRMSALEVRISNHLRAPLQTLLSTRVNEVKVLRLRPTTYLLPEQGELLLALNEKQVARDFKAPKYQ